MAPERLATIRGTIGYLERMEDGRIELRLEVNDFIIIQKVNDALRANKSFQGQLGSIIMPHLLRADQQVTAMNHVLRARSRGEITLETPDEQSEPSFETGLLSLP